MEKQNKFHWRNSAEMSSCPPMSMQLSITPMAIVLIYASTQWEAKFKRWCM